jgi:hypothetical protein
MIPNAIETRVLPTETRRSAVRLLAGTPFVGLLASLLSAPESTRAKTRNRPQRKTHHKGLSKSQDKDQDKSRGKDHPPGEKPSPPGHACPPERTCPPDPRLAAVETCRADGGISVRGECSCGWFKNVFDTYGCPEIPSPYVPSACFATIEMTGFCGYGVVPASGTGTTCSSSDECPPLMNGDGTVTAQACVYFRHTNAFECWRAYYQPPPE